MDARYERMMMMMVPYSVCVMDAYKDDAGKVYDDMGMYVYVYVYMQVADNKYSCVHVLGNHSMWYMVRDMHMDHDDNKDKHQVVEEDMQHNVVVVVYMM